MAKKIDDSKILGNLGGIFYNEPVLKSIHDIDDPDINEETAIGISGARIFYANYPVIQSDFPHLGKTVLEDRFKNIPEKKRQRAIYNFIDDWIIRNTSFVSERQASMMKVNTAVYRTNHRVKAYRPSNYGRALVYSIRENSKATLSDDDFTAMGSEDRLLDIKGVGVAPCRTPSHRRHSSGLIKLSDAIGEFIMQLLIQRVLQYSKSEVSTLPVYAILDLGFNLLSQKGVALPAGMIVRRAHQRPKNSAGLFPFGSDGQHMQLEIELLLRRYGITSVNNASTVRVWKEKGQLQIEYGGQLVDSFSDEQRKIIEEVSHIKNGDEKLTFMGINIQHTREVSLDPLKTQLVDFGSYSVKDRFIDPMLSLVSDKLLRWGGTIWPNYDDWVQPHPNLRVPFEYWGEEGQIFGYRGKEGDMKIDVLSLGLASDFRANRISREMITGLIQTYLSTLDEKWSELR